MIAKKKCSKCEFLLFFNDTFICPTHCVLLVVIVRFRLASSAVVGLFSPKEERNRRLLRHAKFIVAIFVSSSRLQVAFK